MSRGPAGRLLHRPVPSGSPEPAVPLPDRPAWLRPAPQAPGNPAAESRPLRGSQIYYNKITNWKMKLSIKEPPPARIQYP